MQERPFAARSSRLHPVREGRILHALAPRERRLRQPALIVVAEQLLDPGRRRDPSPSPVPLRPVIYDLRRRTGFFHPVRLSPTAGSDYEVAGKTLTLLQASSFHTPTLPDRNRPRIIYLTYFNDGKLGRA